MCSFGCVTDGAELDMSRERARAQLCAPPPNATFALSVPPGSLPAPATRLPPGATRAAEGGRDDDEDEPAADIACEIESYRCDRGVVYRCEGGAVSLFRCVQNCSEEGGTVLAAVSADKAAALLCRR